MVQTLMFLRMINQISDKYTSFEAGLMVGLKSPNQVYAYLSNKSLHFVDVDLSEHICP